MKYLNLSLLMVAAAMLHAGTMAAQTANWFELGSPSPRCCMGLAYDEPTHSTVLFGGANNDKQYLGDTWTWRGGWHPTSPATSPPARTNPGFAPDGTGNLLLFGGETSSGTYLNDTWTWDGTTWTLQSPPVSPSPRQAVAMTYDGVAKTVILFGGNNSAGVLGDTWTWSGVAQTWTQQNPATSPSARAAPMAYDTATQTAVLFGGNGNGGECFTDTWTWNGTTWVEQFPASAPSARAGASMAYDATLGEIVLFGGDANNIWEDSLSDTWAWNGSNWTEIYPATVPPNRYAFGMDYDPVNKALLMFGGYSSTVARGDTWLLALEP